MWDDGDSVALFGRGDWVDVRRELRGLVRRLAEGNSVEHLLAELGHDGWAPADAYVCLAHMAERNLIEVRPTDAEPLVPVAAASPFAPIARKVLERWIDSWGAPVHVVPGELGVDRPDDVLLSSSYLHPDFRVALEDAAPALPIKLLRDEVWIGPDENAG